VLDHHALEHVGNVLAPIRGVFEKIERLFPLDDDNRIALVVEQEAERPLVNAVGLVLEAVDLDRVCDETLVVFKRPEGEPDLLGGRRNDVRELPRAGANRLEAIQPDNGGAGVDRVHDVVERPGEGMNVLAVERRDERAVQPLDNVVRQEVALVLDFLDLVSLVPHGPIRREHGLEQLRAFLQLVGKRLKVVVKPRLARDQPKRQNPWIVADRLSGRLQGADIIHTVAVDIRWAILLAAAVATIAAVVGVGPRPSAKQLIAHRGASAYAPEHTLAAYRLALEQGADYVEQDLAVTRDGTLICLHDDTLERTSNVAEIFPGRFAKDPGRAGTRWIANDFTLDEIRRLDTGRWFDVKFAGEAIVTWQEAIDLVRGKAGLYPELKSPPLYVERGIDMVKMFVESVRANGLDRPESLRSTPMIVQSFDEPTIERLAAELPSVPRILLMDSLPAPGLSDARLRELAGFVNGIGPAKDLIDRQPDLVRRAHEAGLTVTAYTFRATGAGRFVSAREEMSYYLYTLGIDALFTDNPDLFPRQP